MSDFDATVSIADYRGNRALNLKGYKGENTLSDAQISLFWSWSNVQ